MVDFHGISTILGYLMTNPFYAYIFNIYDLVWLGFMAYQPLFVIEYKSSLYIYIKCIWFGLVEFYGKSTIVGYLMPQLNSPKYCYVSLRIQLNISN